MIQQLAGGQLANQPHHGLASPFHHAAGDAAALDDIFARMAAGDVDGGMRELLPFLQTQRVKSSERDWAAFVELCLRHPLRALLHQDPFTYRAYSKPRGYAGDAVLLDFIY